MPLASEPYKLLEACFHQSDKLAEQKYQERNNSESTYRLPIRVGDYPAFFVLTKEIINGLVSVIEKNSVIHDLMQQSDAMEELLTDFMFRKIESSNEIENIHSSRQELQEAWSSMDHYSLRFSEMLRQYSRLLSSESHRFPEEIAQIRNIYDDMLYNDIDQEAPDNVPDGRLFPKNDVFIASGIKTYHKGGMPEEKIEEDLDSFLRIVEDEEIPHLLRAAVFHFLFGYIHPFYDGNGRMNRYLTTLFLAKKYELAFSFQLSLALRSSRQAYYKAFETCENSLNRGDLTPFIQFFIHVLNQSLDHETELLKKQIDKYNCVKKQY